MAEIHDSDSLRAWLEDRPTADAVLIAARAALRVLPALGWHLGSYSDEWRTEILLPCCRAALVAGFAGNGPKPAATVAVAARAASASARAASADARAADGIFAASVESTATTDAAKAAASAAAAAAAADASVAASGAVDASAGAASAEASSSLAATSLASAYIGSAHATVYSAIQDDAGGLEFGGDYAAVNASAIWPAGTPGWAMATWNRLADHFRAFVGPEGWQVWIDWYQARLDGNPWPMALEEQIALIDDEIWEKGPAVANGKIRRLVEAYRGGDIPDEPDPDRVAQKIAGAPEAVSVSSAEFADQLAAEIDRVERTLPNDPEKLAEAEEYLDRLRAMRDGAAEISDETAQLPANPAEADLLPVAAKSRSLAERIRDNVTWVAGPNRADAIVNVGWVGAAFVFLTLIGFPTAWAAGISAASFLSKTVIERIRDLWKKD